MSDQTTEFPTPEDAFSVDVQVRYQDLDTLEHVNNAVYVTYFEHARTTYLEAVADLDLETYSFVVADLQVTFERPITMGESVVATVETTRLGDSSWTMVYAVYADGERAATGETTLVLLDQETKRSTPIPVETRRQLAEYEGLEA
ncbi:acyl-CoA thioesterase [Natrialbaceae archaeon A-CW3]